MAGSAELNTGARLHKVPKSRSFELAKLDPTASREYTWLGFAVLGIMIVGNFYLGLYLVGNSIVWE
jgi:hypothetical protein